MPVYRHSVDVAAAVVDEHHRVLVIQRRDNGNMVLHRATTRGEARTTYVPGSTGYDWTKEFRAPGVGTWSPMVSGRVIRQTA